MNLYLTEEEQLERIRQWWKKNGLSTIMIVIAAFALSFGWRFYQQQQEEKRANASIAYEQMMSAVENSDKDMLRQQAPFVFHNYKDTVYASFSMLQQARDAVYSNNLKDAEDKLQWVITNSHSEALHSIATLRLARVLIADNQADKAIPLLNTLPQDAFKPLSLQIQGDAYLTLGDKEKALAAYQEALSIMPSIPSLVALLQMQIDALMPFAQKGNAA